MSEDVGLKRTEGKQIFKIVNLTNSGRSFLPCLVAAEWGCLCRICFHKMHEGCGAHCLLTARSQKTCTPQQGRTLLPQEHTGSWKDLLSAGKLWVRAPLPTYPWMAGAFYLLRWCHVSLAIIESLEMLCWMWPIRITKSSSSTSD